MQQHEHLDCETPDSYSILIAIQPRDLLFSGREPIVLDEGDVLVFDACHGHGGAGRGADSEGVVFAVHMYAGKGIVKKDLVSTYLVDGSGGGSGGGNGGGGSGGSGGGGGSSGGGRGVALPDAPKRKRG